MIHDPSSLTAALLKNFVTVRFPRGETLWRPDQDLSPQGRIRCHEHATKADALIIGCRRQALRLALLDRGYREFIDHVEVDPDSGWRIYLFLFDPEAAGAVSDMTDGIVGPGCAGNFDPHRWIERQIAQRVRLYARTGLWHWLSDGWM